MALDFAFTEEHDELRATIRAFLAAKSDETAVREQMAGPRGYDPEVWTQLAEQLGLAGLIVPEEHGGAGMGYVELLIAMEEMGRSLLCAPYLGTAVFSVNALLHCADASAQKALLPEIAAGRKFVSVAHAEPGGRWDLASIAVRARAKGDGFELDGTKEWVLDGCEADVVLVVARDGDGLGLFQVAADAEGLTRSPVAELDTTRRLSRLELAATPAVRISSGDQTEALEQVIARVLAALAAEQVGGAQRCLEMATDYAKTRLQFGRPIGSYQAIKHKCADMLVAVEYAKSAAYAACFAAADGSDDFLERAALAKAYCSEAYFHAAADNIQIHGGMGFTWEAACHLYVKRAKARDLFLGDASHHRERLADLVGL
jgi:alkylation response protein AidB-like acyl-CoA dehydrogenase